MTTPIAENQTNNTVNGVGLRILLVEDYPDCAVSMAMLLMMIVLVSLLYLNS